jgi:hypothetical protein
MDQLITQTTYIRGRCTQLNDPICSRLKLENGINIGWCEVPVTAILVIDVLD